MLFYSAAECTMHSAWSFASVWAHRNTSARNKNFARMANLKIYGKTWKWRLFLFRDHIHFVKTFFRDHSITPILWEKGENLVKTRRPWKSFFLFLENTLNIWKHFALNIRADSSRLSPKCFALVWPWCHMFRCGLVYLVA